MAPKTRRQGGTSASPTSAEKSQPPAKKVMRGKKAVTRGNLHAAAAAGDEAQVRALIAAGADVNATREYRINTYDRSNSQNVTPLAVAVAFNHPAIAQLLIDAGADLRPPLHPSTQEPRPLIHLAIDATNAVALVDVLLRSGRCDVNGGYPSETPLHMAVSGRFSVNRDISLLLRLLEEPEIDVNGDPEGNPETPLWYAVIRRFAAAAEALLAAGADPHVVCDIEIPAGGFVPREIGRDGVLEGFSLLHCTAYYGTAALVGPLAAAGADVNARCGEGYPPLTTAILCGREDVDGTRETVAALLAAGADPNALRDNDSPFQRYTPLYYALCEGDRALCEMLVAAGADAARAAPSPSSLAAMMLRLPRRLREGFSPIAEAELAEMRLDILSRAGVDLVAEYAPGRLLLHTAARDGNESVVVALVNCGADATARDMSGATALQLLARAGEERGDRPWHGGISPVTVAVLVRAGDMDSWDSIPTEFPGLGCLLGCVYDKAPEKLGALFSKLTPRAQAVVRGVLRLLHRRLPGGEGLEKVRFAILGQAFEGVWSAAAMQPEGHTSSGGGASSSKSDSSSSSDSGASSGSYPSPSDGDGNGDVSSDEGYM